MKIKCWYCEADFELTPEQEKILKSVYVPARACGKTRMVITLDIDAHCCCAEHVAAMLHEVYGTDDEECIKPEP